MITENKLKHFLWFMQERQRIHIRRQAGKDRPWTQNEILHKYKFTQIYRENDRETIALRDWLMPYAGHPNVPFACAMFRQIGWSETLIDIGFPDPWDPKRAIEVME